MSDDDFSLSSLADYLHLSLGQVERMTQRGQIPGRKVGGQWRFARGEIHHWLESRIGALDDRELAQFEGAMERAAPASAPTSSLADLLFPAAVAVPLEARTRNSTIDAMVELAWGTGCVWDIDKLRHAVRQREDMCPTALDNGVALLHPRRPLPNVLAQPLVAVGLTPRGIPFGGARGMLTDLFFLICSIDDQGHLRTLARISRLISDAATLESLRAQESGMALYSRIVEADAALTP